MGLLVHHRAALTAIGDPIGAPAAETLVRGTAEALAHLTWIAHEERRENRPKEARTKHCFSDNRQRWSTPQTRALCWLMADAQLHHHNIKRAHRWAKHPLAVRKARERWHELARLHSCTDCPGRDGRGYADIRPMLSLLARRYRLWWLPVLWSAYSGTAHQAVPLRLRTEVSPGVVQYGGKMGDRRIRDLLARANAVFVNAFAHVILLSSDPGASQSYQTRVAERGSRLGRELGALSL